jgi:hypothetical protein
MEFPDHIKGLAFHFNWVFSRSGRFRWIERGIPRMGRNLFKHSSALLSCRIFQVDVAASHKLIDCVSKRSLSGEAGMIALSLDLDAAISVSRA